MSATVLKSVQDGEADVGAAAVIYDRSGLPVDISTAIWVLNDPTRLRKINWNRFGVRSSEVVTATKDYICWLIKNQSVTEAHSNFSTLCLLAESSSFVEADKREDVVPYAAFSELASFLGDSSYRSHYFRKWYTWCSDRGYESFSPDVAFRLGQVRIGGNAKAVAVMSSDPQDGPLVDLEVVALLNALRASPTSKKLSVEQRTALWLCLCLGSNPMQFALLRESDFIRYAEADGDGALFGLNVPRHKKGASTLRAESKLRKLTSEIGEVVQELIKFNRERRPLTSTRDADIARPLFARARPRKSMLHGPMRESALGLTAQDFTALVASAAEALGVISPRTGEPLKVTTRRLRYTFATRLVREGASQRLVAELLDHSDLQNVQCYFDLKSDIVESLDRAMAMTMAPLAQAFLGHVVRSERDAVRGDRPSSRVYRAKVGEAAPVGTCGSFSFCGLYAPIACYTCVKFQPWMDAPHGQVLEDLLEERKRREERGLDARMIAVNDVTILAVADVVARVASLATGETAHVG